MRVGWSFSIALVAATLSLGTANSATLNLAEYAGSYHQHSLELNYAAAYTSRRGSVIVNDVNALCAARRNSDRCGSNLRLDFHDPVTNLSFDASGERGRAIIRAFLSGKRVARVLVRAGETVDLSQYGEIDRLKILHVGRDKHLRTYSDFGFLIDGEELASEELAVETLGIEQETYYPPGYGDEHGGPVSAVPIPPAAALFLSGLAFMGWMRRRGGTS